MNEWIVPLTGFLTYLFFCPGCFLWVWLHNRMFAAGEREKGRIDIPVRRQPKPRILKPVTTILVLAILYAGGSAYGSPGHNGPPAGRPAGRTYRTIPVKTLFGNAGKRGEFHVRDYPGRRAGQAPGGRA